ncbi:MULTISPECIES: CPBP family intramembrane glutamic endopeptidase [unclassified Nonomuraea]|uniref:CPBP family intramembrane glutamic endopeptidase n=1 Tax=Nonomuraea sp. NPDC047529 TaxID=3155623 RepID=UPI0033DF5294
MRKQLAVFLVLAFGLSWLVALPIWLGAGLASPAAKGLAAVMMFTPTAGVLGVWALSRAPWRRWAAETGLTLGESKGRTGRYVLAAWLGVPLLIAVCAGLSTAVGLFPLDLDRFSLYRATLEAAGVRPPADPGPALYLQIAIGVLAGPVLNAIPALGEEWGWRGWLLPRLSSTYGAIGGLALSGAIWGLWHAPVTLLGYNYPSLGSWAALQFIGFCVLAGIAVGWLRLRTGSVWPCVVAHGSLNAVLPAVLLLGDAAAPPDTAVSGLTGLVGWVPLALLCVILLRTLRTRVPQPVA